VSGFESSPDAERRRLRDLFQDVDFEVIPLSGVVEKARVLPPGATVTVTASPSRGMQATVDVASRLQQGGFEAVPHLAARMIADRAQLATMLATLRSNGVTRVFVIGGDPDPVGVYEDAGALLRDMVELGHPFVEVGIAGYPEGHPGIDDRKLGEALRSKATMATQVVTQMCFDPGTIIDWVGSIRQDGIELPLKLGVPGAVEMTRLLAIAARIGVGDSLRVLAKNRGLLRMLRPGRYTPDRLIEGVARSKTGADFAGLHLFTFNQVAATAAWRDEWLERLGAVG
jgi:methylenetetrahydrofolate reductase (NADPH)